MSPTDLPLPCPAVHPQPPFLDGICHEQVSLVPYAYRADELVESTVIGILNVDTEYSSARQQEAIRNFRNIYSNHCQLTVQELHRRNVGELLVAMMTSLDQALFFGSLTDSRHPIVKVVPVDQATLGDGEYDADSWCAGRCSPQPDVNGRPQSILKVAHDDPWRSSRVLGDMLTTLVHEMVHAYVDAYTCDGDACEKNVLNTRGLSGHGPSFRAILDVAMTALSRIDGCVMDLTDFSTSFQVEKAELVRRDRWVRDQVQAGMLLPLQNKPSPDSPIKVYDSYVQISTFQFNTRLLRCIPATKSELQPKAITDP